VSATAHVALQLMESTPIFLIIRILKNSRTSSQGEMSRYFHGSQECARVLYTIYGRFSSLTLKYKVKTCIDRVKEVRLDTIALLRPTGGV